MDSYPTDAVISLVAPRSHPLMATLAEARRIRFEGSPDQSDLSPANATVSAANHGSGNRTRTQQLVVRVSLCDPSCGGRIREYEALLLLTEPYRVEPTTGSNHRWTRDRTPRGRRAVVELIEEMWSFFVELHVLNNLIHNSCCSVRFNKVRFGPIGTSFSP